MSKRDKTTPSNRDKTGKGGRSGSGRSKSDGTSTSDSVESDADKVIHVVFGPGGGRVDPSRAQAALGRDASGRDGLSNAALDAMGRHDSSGNGASRDSTPPPSSREPVSDLFSLGEVARLLSMSTGRLRTLDKAGVVAPSGRRRGKRAYTFQDLIALRAARDLLAKRVRLRDVARAIDSIKSALPKVTRPLAELSIVSDGRSVVLRSPVGAYEPITGQMLLDFDVRALRDDVVRVLRPAAGRARARTAYDLYVKASQMDEDPATL
ncbi:MAG TPA: MerR family transcriptional regulator [Polyangiaceae bacterium]|nr:MerR family transcriptional regulator [Polyangiaceae bacterium]